MQTGVEKTVEAFKEGKPYKPASRRSIWTDGQAIYSYGTAIVWRNAAGVLVRNVRRYSVTTTRKQNQLRGVFPDAVEA